VELNYYPFHLGDYAAHTGHLEPMEDLAYRRLLDQYYMREGPLPADIQATAKLCRMRSCAADVEAVLREFFTLTEDGWHHTRCEEEIAKMQDKQQIARDKANARWDKQRKERSTADAMQQHGQVDAAASNSDAKAMLPTPTPTPTPKKEKDSVSAKPTPARFEEFWSTWPKSSRKVAKAECLKRWVSRGLDAQADAILADVKAMRGTRQWLDGYEPAPLTYLRQSRWEDGQQSAADSGWWADAGFASVHEANNARCFEHNAGEFRDGKRVQAVIA
jgi:uncharacterized protein YdaU (DUF1376 family)